MMDDPNHEKDDPSNRKGTAGILPHPVGGSGIIQEDDGSGSADEDQDDRTPSEDDDVPGRQTRTMTDDEKLDKSLEDTFPTSDPIGPSRIDGPNN